mgnify:CR=1 FL=1
MGLHVFRGGLPVFSEGLDVFRGVLTEVCSLGASVRCLNEFCLVFAGDRFMPAGGQSMLE